MSPRRLGIALALCAGINTLPMPTRFEGMILSPQAAALTVFSLVAIGVLTALYPARRAAERMRAAARPVPFATTRGASSPARSCRSATATCEGFTTTTVARDTGPASTSPRCRRRRSARCSGWNGS